MLNPFASAAAALSLCSFALAAQSLPSAMQKGLEAPWDVRNIATGLVRDAEQTQQILAQVNPQAWVVSKGAPSTYIVQWQTAQQQARDVVTVSRSFSQHTDSLSTALDAYFRLEALELSERALNEGAQRYDTQPNAGRLETAVAKAFDSRQRLREYLRNLASSTEENFKIADSEAQRCRSTLSRQPAPGTLRAK